MMNLQKMLELGWTVTITRTALGSVVQHDIVATRYGRKIEYASAPTLDDAIHKLAGQVQYEQLPVASDEGE